MDWTNKHNNYDDNMSSALPAVWHEWYYEEDQTENISDRSRHCPPVLPGIYSAIFIQLLVPNRCTTSISCCTINNNNDNADKLNYGTTIANITISTRWLGSIMGRTLDLWSWGCWFSYQSSCYHTVSI